MSNKIKLGEIVIALRRKLLTAIISSLLFALFFTILALFFTTPARFDGDLFFTLYYLNLMIVITFGVLVSLFSDFLSKEMSKKTYTREIISFIFHCAGGAPLKALGLVSAILFFIVDRILKKVKVGWLSVIIALFIVVLVFIIMIQ
ncbi:hypothetical protein IEO70_06110 [Bacillus sp. AGMB 02131]|uniref:Uncharacterized protein n=1 Tax=Peribacillus faecalis TaxID=2772559 RepID=A0A927CXV8_9BACI|nr:hypothetical protein [Peribacillus faecalis]MBD3107935.1 hypothetical protein [Peribacillus faecalis]